MPIPIVFYKEFDGEIPVLDWLLDQQPAVVDKCLAKLIRLKELGHLLRRPDADVLRDKIYELRAVSSGSQYRILYFFHGQKAVVLAVGFAKKTDKVPEKFIDLAIRRKSKFDVSPDKHSHSEEIDES